MHKIWLIIRREYLVRVRKKSFIIMTILAPLLLAALMVVPVWLATVTDDTETVEILDESGLFAEAFKSDEEIKFIKRLGNQEQIKQDFLESDHTALLYIPKFNLDKPEGIKLFSRNNTSLKMKMAMERILKKEIEEMKFQRSGISQQVLDKIKTDIEINTINLSETGEKDSNAFVTSAAGYVGAILIYFFIFIYGVQIMRGVIEEKTSRIVEVMISSVKPFQLMMGKIIGIAAVGLTQFLLWIILSTVTISVVSASFGLDKFNDQQIEQTMQNSPDAEQAKEINDIWNAVDNLPLAQIIGCFLFYFLGGYLLYGALFAGIGGAVDNETDTQQFMIPITIPLVMSFIVAQTVVIKNPDGPVAFWMSMIPFTSPIVMMLRVPFGVPLHEILMSMFFLALGFLATTWLAGRIYRVGILMYGKKVNYRELSKWLFYKV